MKFRDYLQVIIVVILLSTIFFLYVQIISYEKSNKKTLDSLISVQHIFNDSLFKVLSNVKPISATEINNYYTTKYEKEKDIILDYTLDEHISFFTKWYLSNKDSIR